MKEPKSHSTKNISKFRVFMIKCSKYCNSLSESNRSVYLKKIEKFSIGFDPYNEEDGWTNKLDILPCCSWPDLFIYMVSGIDHSTKEANVRVFFNSFLAYLKNYVRL